MKAFIEISNAAKDHIVMMIEQNQLSIIDGGLLNEFEVSASRLFGHDYAVATCNGTSAIHLAYFGVGIDDGDEVIVATYGFHAMILPLLQLGGVPVFCDIDPITLTLSCEDIKNKITKRTKAIMVIQPWGNVADIDSLKQVADSFGLMLISDSSHAHSAKWNGKPLGKYFDIVCASFGKGKLITGGELGSLTTNDKQIRDRALLYSHPNRVPGAYITDEYQTISNSIGIKYRPHALALRLALDQFGDFEPRIQRLNKNIENLVSTIISNGFNVPHAFKKAERNYWKIIVIAETEKIKAIRKAADLGRLRIEGNHYDPLLHQDSIVTEYYGIRQNGFPNAENLKGRVCQIDAMQMYDESIVGKYIKLFNDAGK